MAKEQSLLAYLCTKNPEVIRVDLKSGSNSTDNNSRNSKSSKRSKQTIPWKLPAHISEWKEFNFDTLKSIYSGRLFQVLNKTLPCTDFSNIPLWPFRRVANENSIDSLLCKWTHSTVSEALSKAQDDLYRQRDGRTAQPNSQTIFMARGGQALYEIDTEVGRAKSFPDWSGIQPFRSSPAESMPQNILPGDTKVSSKWHSGCITAGQVENRAWAGTWLDPISQVQTYCRICKARYGYIITDKELVVLRIQRIRQKELNNFLLSKEETRDANRRTVNQRSAKGKGTLNNESRTSNQDDSQEIDSNTQEMDWEPAGTRHAGDSDKENDTDENPIYHYGVEYKAIDWDQTERSEDTQDLTINLALWWLYMMASKNSSMENFYPALGQQTWESDSETAESTAGKTPNRSRKRKRSSPIPVPAAESTDAGGDIQEPEGSKPRKKHVGRKRGR